MNLITIRELFPCPDCGVDASELCLSLKGIPMERYTHPNRSLAARTTNEEVIRLRNWLAHHSDIFQETE
jgi:hypothetical protein